MAKKKSASKNNKSKDNLKNKDNKTNSNNHQTLKAFIASFFTIIGFIIALLAWRDDKYVMYYAKHGLVLFIAELVIWALPNFSFATNLAWILWFVLWVITWINALSGKMKNTIIISDIAKMINF
jgi:uncharacterized membrane protein|tara:strand:+ start:906 stop:1277 length:372 start_codon:yes stop_codon:yes gene_type:complete